MTTSTLTLTDFLLARIKADETRAWEMLDSPLIPVHEGIKPGVCHPSRVLAECEAKRRIVELHKVTHWGVSSGPWNEPPRNGAGCSSCFEWHRYPDLGRAWEEPAHSPCPTLRTLAAIYSDHPDFDPAWS